MSKESEMNRVNLFTEARVEAGLEMYGAAALFGEVSAESLKKVSDLEKELFPYPLPKWSHKYLSELRRIAFWNGREA